MSGAHVHEHPVAISPDDRAFQDHALRGVSRTFALTIPQLPEDLRLVVGNAYLLCRIADTIEDSPALTPEEKHAFSEAFVQAVQGHSDGAEFARGLAARLDHCTLDAERELVRQTPRVLRMARAFPERDQQAVRRCVRIMVDGMERFQEGAYQAGLRDQAQLDTYCYHVAGVVGEMLTELFCAHREAVDARKAELEARAVSFGQGLQMTNILKDIWDDKTRKVCWLPRTTFEAQGFDLAALDGGAGDHAFQQALGTVIAVATQHLERALEYTLLLPRRERGMRRFCLWALCMAVLTLRNINRRRDFTSSSEVKISRWSVRSTVFLTSALAGNNWALRQLFRVFAAGLPRLEPAPETPSPASAR